MAVDCLSSAENEEYDEHGRLLLNHHLSAVLELASEWRDTLSYDGPWPAPLLLAQCLFERTFASVPLDSAMDEINLKSPFVKVHLKLFGQLLRRPIQVHGHSIPMHGPSSRGPLNPRSKPPLDSKLPQPFVSHLEANCSLAFLMSCFWHKQGREETQKMVDGEFLTVEHPDAQVGGL